MRTLTFFAGAAVALALLIANEAIAIDRPVAPVKPVLNLNTQGCLELKCTTAGDGGSIAAVTGTDYAWTVTDKAAIRVANGAPTNYATGTGELVAKGAMLQAQTARASPDGGAPAYYCASESEDAGQPVFQICPAPVP